MSMLFVDACPRGEKSRTLALARALLARLTEKYPGHAIDTVDLSANSLRGLSAAEAGRRMRLCAEEDYSAPVFSYAREFAAAEMVVIAAPYWDMLFPAALRAYLERVAADGVTFRYTREGRPEGLCRARTLFYVTTAGGYLADKNFGYDYICALAQMYGIGHTACLAAEGLDIAGNDAEAIMAAAVRPARLEKIIRSTTED